jgi:hypothetical protein
MQYAQVWGEFCNSPESINPETMKLFYAFSENISVTDSMIPINKEEIPVTVSQFTIHNRQGKSL